MATIQDALNAVYRYGTVGQRQIINAVCRSAIVMHIAAPDRNASGDCGLLDAAQTQLAINGGALGGGSLSIGDALGHIKIRIHPTTAQTNAGIEGTMVHETRHAYDMARAIVALESGKANRFDPTDYELEYAAHEAYVEYARRLIALRHPNTAVFLNEALNSVPVAKKSGNTIIANRGLINARLVSEYGLASRGGATFSAKWKLEPKAVVRALGRQIR